ncbi:uncharacterized protein LOC112525236 [Cynara cardunculus var. scolymus]|uniref:uncharacterized protein LOC112525236 n=1 Tax=Cynara cardunculus var. scolymus TaxID=59895 RepID=UPI000D62C9E7|nr:uncharacterized protein LOC112525236 [Cynara cardunculus var. scolymus]
MQCPTNNFFRYNTTLCACNPGYFYNTTDDTCSPFTASSGDDFLVGSGVDYSINIPVNIFAFDTIKRFTQSQAVFLETTFVLVLCWLVFCFFVRFGKLGDGRTPWFQIRWWISRLDVAFATRHWLDDQKVVKKRKTELGGAFSIASWILFIGLFAALLYQVISTRTIEVHSVLASNAPDLASFNNDMEFNITTVSSMSCSNLQGLGTLVTGNPGFIDYRRSLLSTFVNFSCQNTTKGPTITLKCDDCHLVSDNIYISWQFVDLPNVPATAVGFEFKLTARDRQHKKHLSFVSGALKNGSTNSAKFVTYRGKDPNIVQFNLFPRIYRNKHDLKLIQPLFHEFIPGSSFDEASQLQASLQRSSDGLVNTMLYINFLSAYIVQIDNQNTLGPVGFLADLGGLYCVSIGIFFYFLVQFEYRFKRFRHEDDVMRSIRNRRKAQEQWDKLRKYVNFTWGRGLIPSEDGVFVEKACCNCFPNLKGGSSFNQRKQIRMGDLSFNTKLSTQSERGLGAVKEIKEKSSMHSNNANTPRQEALTVIPLPPSLEMRAGSKISIPEIQKNLENIYEYNVMLREKLVIAQSTIQALTSKASASSSSDQIHQ